MSKPCISIHKKTYLDYGDVINVLYIVRVGGKLAPAEYATLKEATAFAQGARHVLVANHLADAGALPIVHGEELRIDLNPHGLV